MNILSEVLADSHCSNAHDHLLIPCSLSFTILLLIYILKRFWTYFSHLGYLDHSSTLISNVSSSAITYTHHICIHTLSYTHTRMHTIQTLLQRQNINQTKYQTYQIIIHIVLGYVGATISKVTASFHLFIAV